MEKGGGPPVGRATGSAGGRRAYSRGEEQRRIVRSRAGFLQKWSMEKGGRPPVGRTKSSAGGAAAPAGRRTYSRGEEEGRTTRPRGTARRAEEGARLARSRSRPAFKGTAGAGRADFEQSKATTRSVN